MRHHLHLLIFFPVYYILFIPCNADEEEVYGRNETV